MHPPACCKFLLLVPADCCQPLCTPIAPYRYDLDLRDSRELALQRLARFCRSGFVSVTDFRHDPLRIFAAHECAAIIDPSMATKMTVSMRAAQCCLQAAVALLQADVMQHAQSRSACV